MPQKFHIDTEKCPLFEMKPEEKTHRLFKKNMGCFGTSMLFMNSLGCNSGFKWQSIHLYEENMKSTVNECVGSTQGFLRQYLEIQQDHPN